MQWNEIKREIQRDLLSRDLAEPRIRLGALDRLEKLLVQCYQDFEIKPEQLLIIGKEAVKVRLSKLKTTGRLNGAESSVLNQIFAQLRGLTPQANKIDGKDRDKPLSLGGLARMSLLASKVNDILPTNEEAFSSDKVINKLAPLACAVAEMLFNEFGYKVNYTFEERLDWLNAVPSKDDLAPVWDDVCRVYYALVDGAFSLEDQLTIYASELRRGLQRVDVWFDAPYSFALEFDEDQHFSQFRLRTLDNFPRYSEFPFDVKAYRVECLQRHVAPGVSGFTKLKTFDPLFPPMLPSDKQDNRVRQRAFKDFLKDIVPFIRPDVNNTWRIGAYLVGWKRVGFTKEDCQKVCHHLRQVGAVDSMRQNLISR